MRCLSSVEHEEIDSEPNDESEYDEQNEESESPFRLELLIKFLLG
jgi:hypothetical protein